MGQNEFWLAIAVIALVTWLTRATPFLLMRKSNTFGRLTSERFVILGPALLVSMTVVVIYSDLQQAAGFGPVLAYLCGLIGAGACVKLTRNAGFAVLVGMAAYGVAVMILPG